MRLAVIAGEGDFIEDIISQLDGNPIVISLSDKPRYNYHYKFSPGEVGGILKVLEKEGIDSVFFIGKIERKGIFGGLKFDLTALKLVGRLKSFSDDAIMNEAIKLLKEKNIAVLSQKEVLKNFIAPEGFICGKLTDSEWDDVVFGFTVAKRLGELGIGQTVVVKRLSVISVEAIEGTDCTIERAGRYVKDFVVVKVKRPQQNPFMDLPFVGERTLKIMKESGGKVLAVEASNTLIVGKNFRDLAKRLGIKVVGVGEDIIGEKGSG